MKRTGDWGRNVPLTSTTPLSRSTPLPRSRVRTLAEVRASRPTVSREERHARKLLAARSGGTCEGCGRAPATDYAHRVGRAQGGLWCPSNALHLCGGLAAALARPGALSCHAWSHANPTEARSVGWLLRSTDDYLTFPALLPVHGLVLLRPDGTFTPTSTEGTAA